MCAGCYEPQGVLGHQNCEEVAERCTGHRGEEEMTTWLYHRFIYVGFGIPWERTYLDQSSAGSYEVGGVVDMLHDFHRGYYVKYLTLVYKSI